MQFFTAYKPGVELTSNACWQRISNHGGIQLFFGGCQKEKERTLDQGGTNCRQKSAWKGDCKKHFRYSTGIIVSMVFMTGKAISGPWLWEIVTLPVSSLKPIYFNQIENWCRRSPFRWELVNEYHFSLATRRTMVGIKSKSFECYGFPVSILFLRSCSTQAKPGIFQALRFAPCG